MAADDQKSTARLKRSTLARGAPVRSASGAADAAASKPDDFSDFAEIERLVRAGRVVEFFPERTKRKNRFVCRIIVADKRHGWDEGGGTDEAEGRGATCAEAMREALEDQEDNT